MWKFKSSYKHMFWYEKDYVTVCIMGDIYRDCFEPTMTDSKMEYFRNQDGIDVLEVDGGSW